MMGTKTMMTVDQFAQMKTSDIEDFELIDGELIPLSSGTYRHNKIRDLIGHLLWSYFMANPIGEAIGENDCRIAEDIVRRPDLSIFLNSERLIAIDLDRVPVPFAPDIAIEVLSPSESAIDVRRKVRDYLAAGAKEVWLVDHSNRELMVHTNGGIRIIQETGILETPLLPGFAMKLADVVPAPK